MVLGSDPKASNLTEGQIVKNSNRKGKIQASDPFLGVASIPPDVLLDQTTSGNAELR